MPPRNRLNPKNLRKKIATDNTLVVKAKCERLDPVLRKKQILDMAILIAEEVGYKNIRQPDVTRRLGISIGLIHRYFGTMAGLKEAVLEAAIERGILTIVIQGLLVKDPIAMNAPEELKKKARDHLY